VKHNHVWIWLFAICFIVVNHAVAEEHWAVSEATRNGFTGCDSFIREQVAPEGEIFSDWFPESSRNNFSIIQSQGDLGDQWITRYDFHKSGNRCFVSKASNYLLQGDCATVQLKLESYITTSVQGEIVWTRGENGTGSRAAFWPVGPNNCFVTTFPSLKSSTD